MKALCVALLNYGAAAQTYFGYKTDALVNAELTEAQKALVVAYEDVTFPGAAATVVPHVGDFAKTEAGFGGKSASVSFDGTFSINCYYTPDKTVQGSVTFYYWSADAFTGADTLTAENATGVVPMYATGNGLYWAAVTGIAAREIDKPYYIAAVYEDADGNSYCSGVSVYSISKYCVSKAGSSNAALAEFAKTTAMYGYYANAFFSGLNQ
jgi:hypothetical protein